MSKLSGVFAIRSPLHARVVVISTLLLAMIAISYGDPSFALPPNCKQNPGGTLECISPTAEPYKYLGVTCAPQYFDSEPAAQTYFDSVYMAGYTACPGHIYNRVGWVPASSPMCLNGPCGFPPPYISVACGGSPYGTPSINSVGLETVNWLYYQIGGNQNPPTCNPIAGFLRGAVRRDRSIVCPRGYGLSAGICYLQSARLDVAKNLGPQCPSCGNPIAPGSGNKFQKETDYMGAGEHPLKFERFYNSLQRNRNNEPGYYSAGSLSSSTAYRLATAQGRVGFTLPMGQERRDLLRWANLGLDSVGGNWRHTYLRSIHYVANNASGINTAFAYRHDGRVFAFTESGGGFVASADVVDRLSGSPSSGYTYVAAEGDETETYNADGRLLSIASRSGQVHTLQYDADGRLTSVTDQHGRTLSFGYDLPAGDPDAVYRVVSITDPAAQVYQYGYTGENLTSVTYPGNRVRGYQYAGGTFPRALTGIVDENGAQFATFGYDTGGQASLSQHAGGAGQVGVAYAETADYTTGNATVTDALGVARTYTFTSPLGLARVASITQPAASGTGTKNASYGYDANGNLTKSRDFNGRLTCYSYNLARNLETSRTEGLSGTNCPGTTIPGITRTITTSWHASFRLAVEINEPNRRTTFTHDASGNVLTRTVTDLSVMPNASRTWTYTHNGIGQILTEDGPRTDVSDLTTYAYHVCSSGGGCGRLHTVTNAAGHVTTYDTYDANGRPTQIVDPNGVVTTLAYNFRGQLTSKVVSGETTTLAYDDVGQLKKVTQPDGSFLEYFYDGAHRLWKVADNEGNRIEYTLDAMGNRTEERSYDPSNALTATHTRVFNSLNRLWKDVNAAGTAAVTTTFGYDDNGNQTSIAAPLSRNTAQLYDELNRLKQVTDPATGVAQFGYDANDNLTSVSDPRSLVTSYQYNGFGDVKELTSPDTGVTTSTYDAGGNLATRTDARSKTGTYGYDVLNRVTSITYPDQTLAFTYDAGTHGKGHLTGASDANHSLSFTYDAQGRASGKSQTVGTVTKSVAYGYTDGNLTSLTTPSGQTIAYGYAHGRIASITLSGTTTILNQVLHDPFGPVTGWTWGNGTLAARPYDADGKIESLESAGATTYAYDDAFRITGITDLDDASRSWTYGYDALDRLTSGAKSGQTLGYTYDANGNRLTQTGTQSATYTVSGSSNRLASITGTPARTYSYDAAGNVTGYGALTFAYADSGRLKSVTNASGTTTYTLNALGQRVKKAGTLGTRLFVYDEAGHLLGEYDGSGTLIQETVWMGDMPVATLRPNGGSVSLFYVHSDHLNTPRRISRPSDNVIVWRWDSDPFGSAAANEDPDGDSNAFAYSLRFPGQYHDLESGLSYNYFRDYDPAKGGYIQSDPIGLKAGVNTYGYVAGNPVSFADPRGLAIGQDDDNYCWEGVGIKCANKKLPPTDRIPPSGPKDPRDPAKGKKPGADYCAKNSPNYDGCNACCARGALRFGTHWQGQCVAECGWYHAWCPGPPRDPWMSPVNAAVASREMF